MTHLSISHEALEELAKDKSHSETNFAQKHYNIFGGNKGQIGRQEAQVRTLLHDWFFFLNWGKLCQLNNSTTSHPWQKVFSTYIKSWELHVHHFFIGKCKCTIKNCPLFIYSCNFLLYISLNIHLFGDLLSTS